ncbi:MAG: 50S ribosomal protein L25/general stress protein Ctc [Hyphomicrobiales bacterium]|nr:50S ribosomal protein L25/general stress protein Ctc [Hyphomicrobiales bacterium]
MAELLEIKANPREFMKKTALRTMRKGGNIPGVIYGDQKPAESVTLEYKRIFQLMQSGAFLSTVYMLDIDGKKQRVIPRDVQVDPVRDFPMHVDFLRVSKTARLDVEVAVRFINEEASPGLKGGGALNVVLHTVELECSADNIPEFIEVDLTGLDYGDSVHISQVKLPEGVKPTITDRDFTIATIAGATTEEEEPSAAGADAAEA